MTTSRPDRSGPDLDTRGQKCPLPVLGLARLARSAEPGSVLVVWADDPAAESDIPAWARMRGARVTFERHGGHTAYRVRLGDPQPKRS